LARDNTVSLLQMCRKCPNCSDNSIQIKEILFRNSRCPECQRIVGVHRAAAAFFSVVIFLVTVLTSFIVLVELGFYGALIWFSVPVGALSYLKARFAPLEIKAEPYHPSGVSGA